MDELLNHLPDAQTLDLFVKRVLSKKVLTKTQEVFQEGYRNNTPTGEKLPLSLFIINKTDSDGDPIAVKCLKLVKRVLSEGYPQNSLICTSKSKITIRFQLVLLVEFEDDSFEILTLPNDLSNPAQFNPNTTKAFVDSTVIGTDGIPILQRQSVTVPYETMIINGNAVNTYPSFTYSVTVPFSEFSEKLKPRELYDPTLQSYILLKYPEYDIDVSELVDVEATNILTRQPVTVSTTMVEFSLFEDITDKLGIDQDVLVRGIPEDDCE